MLVKKRKATADGRIRLENLPRNWLHQAITYMDRGELRLRILLEAAETGALWWMLSHLLPGHPQYDFAALGVALVLAHTLNWISNGNFWALMLFAFPRMRNRGEAATRDYLNGMAERLMHHRSIGGLALFGSISRGEWHERSDVDARIIRRPGLWNLVKAYLLTMRERWLALIGRQPMDIFLADGVEFLRRMRSDERPIFLLKRDSRLEAEYPGNDPRLLGRLR